MFLDTVEKNWNYEYKHQEQPITGIEYGQLRYCGTKCKSWTAGEGQVNFELHKILCREETRTRQPNDFFRVGEVHRGTDIMHRSFEQLQKDSRRCRHYVCIDGNRCSIVDRATSWEVWQTSQFSVTSPANWQAYERNVRKRLDHRRNWQRCSDCSEGGEGDSTYGDWPFSEKADAETHRTIYIEASWKVFRNVQNNQRAQKDCTQADRA